MERWLSNAVRFRGRLDRDREKNRILMMTVILVVSLQWVRVCQYLQWRPERQRQAGSRRRRTPAR